MTAQTVDHHVTWIRQQSEMTCWAAAMAMIVNFRDGTHYDDHTLCDHVGLPKDGATVSQVDDALRQLNMHLLAPACNGPEGWIDVLHNGPKGIIVPGAPWHRIVVSGVHTDGTLETTQIHVLDPAVGDHWLTYQDVETKFEAGYPRSNNIFGY